MAIVKITLDVSKVSTITSVLRQRQNDRTAYTADVVILRNGEAVDLTDTKILFEGTTSKGAKIIDDSGIVIKDAKNGQFTYSMPAVALQDIGAFKTAYFSLTKGETRETTNDFAVFVLASVDIPADEMGDYLSEYEKLLQQLRTLYDSYDIDAIEAEMAKIRSEMTDLQADIDKQLATAKADMEQQLKDAKAEIQSMIDEITKTLTDKDVAIRGEENHFTAKMIVDDPIEGSVTGSATTASRLNTSRRINGVPFDGTIDVNIPGVTQWYPNMHVYKYQLITFKSLGTAKTGLLTNPIFMSLIDQTTGTTFPAADSIDGVSGKWKLINLDSYTYNIGDMAMPYGGKVNPVRRGNNVNAYWDSAFTSVLPSNLMHSLGTEKWQLGLRPEWFKGSGNNATVRLKLQDTDGNDGVQFQIANDGTIWITTTTGFPVNNVLIGDVSFNTDDAMIWSAGVPTV